MTSGQTENNNDLKHLVQLKTSTASYKCLWNTKRPLTPAHHLSVIKMQEKENISNTVKRT